MNLEAIMTKMKKHTPGILGQQKLKPFSILLPLIEKDGELHLLFEVRSQNIRQPGEVCFPGGKKDAEDRHDKDTAVRESMEELGVDDKDIEQVFPLGQLVGSMDMRVNTYVGFINRKLEEVVPNPDEVGEVFTVPLSFFLNNKPEVHYVTLEVKPGEDFPYELIPNGRDYNWRPRQMGEYFYIYGEKVIWGLTARVLYHFIEILQEESK
ncbi:NUDIX domain-containing protein [Thalassobacillus cyri]|uniref:NUDIX domain-containing protein n=1 Tax=Thalassobacillus cyri TaxID=571932 RepID=A0A1H3XGV9_9BACI|nr:CoA pyrophosphatase [Thalassobacillus cyri]SDZ98583.1 NUDIX domain-containing protein [Thalassobacillus cyri]